MKPTSSITSSWPGNGDVVIYRCWNHFAPPVTPRTSFILDWCDNQLGLLNCLPRRNFGWFCYIPFGIVGALSPGVFRLGDDLIVTPQNFLNDFFAELNRHFGWMCFIHKLMGRLTCRYLVFHGATRNRAIRRLHSSTWPNSNYTIPEYKSNAQTPPVQRYALNVRVNLIQQNFEPCWTPIHCVVTRLGKFFYLVTSWLAHKSLERMARISTRGISRCLVVGSLLHRNYIVESDVESNHMERIGYPLWLSGPLPPTVATVTHSYSTKLVGTAGFEPAIRVIVSFNTLRSYSGLSRCDVDLLECHGSTESTVTNTVFF